MSRRPARRTLPGYELEHRLGRGATSAVWRARQLSSMGRPVALKRVRDAAAARAEAEVLATLDHPHIVRIFEVVEDGADLAIAMQLAAGGSLDERLARRGPMPAAEVAEVVAKLAAALASAHRRGVLHRDVKPANVLFTADGEPLLSDFGIAAWTGRSSDDDGLIRGTEAYLDPTVLAGRPADAAADIYALGAVAAEMLGGLDGAPPALAAVVRRCLAADPGKRFGSAAEVAAALPSLVLEGPNAARTETREFGPRPPAPAGPATGGPGAARWRAPAVAAGMGLLALGAVLILRPPAGAEAAPCPSVPAAAPGILVGDTDGDGCPDVVARQGHVLVHDGVRFAVGEAGDVPVLGDWDCDGTATPGVFRPATGEAHLFDGWADAAEPLAATRTVATAAPPTAECEVRTARS